MRTLDLFLSKRPPGTTAAEFPWTQFSVSDLPTFDDFKSALEGHASYDGLLLFNQDYNAWKADVSREAATHSVPEEIICSRHELTAEIVMRVLYSFARAGGQVDKVKFGKKDNGNSPPIWFKTVHFGLYDDNNTFESEFGWHEYNGLTWRTSAGPPVTDERGSISELSTFLAYNRFKYDEAFALAARLVPCSCTARSCNRRDVWSNWQADNPSLTCLVNASKEFFTQAYFPFLCHESSNLDEYATGIQLSLAARSPVSFSAGGGEHKYLAAFVTMLIRHAEPTLIQDFHRELANQTIVRLRARMFEHTVYELLERDHRRSEELRKQSEMLELLQGPLKQLTNALEKTQQDAQELRAILYSPARGVFAAHSVIERYFAEGAMAQIGAIRFKVQHEPSRYEEVGRSAGQEGDPLAACATIAAVVCAIFGQSLTDILSGRHLYERLSVTLYSKRRSFSSLQELVKKLLFGGHANSMDEFTGRACLEAILSNEPADQKAAAAVTMPNGNKIPNEWWKAQTCILLRLKALTFDPFKTKERSLDLLPLVFSVFPPDREPSLKFNGAAYANWSDVLNLHCTCSKDNRTKLAKSDGGLPFSGYHHLLEVVAGLCDMQTERTSVNELDIVNSHGHVTIKIKFGSGAFIEKGVKEAINAIMKNDHHDGQRGNFHRPLFEMKKFSRKKLSRTKGGLGLKAASFSFQFSFDGPKSSLSIGFDEKASAS